MSATTDNGDSAAGSPAELQAHVREQVMESPAAKKREAKRQKHQESTTLQQEIENSLADESVRIPVGGHPVQWNTFDGETSDRVALINERLDQMNADDWAERYADEVEWMCETLADSAEHGWMDAEWFRENFTISKRRKYLTYIQNEDDLTETDIKKLQRRLTLQD